MAHNTDNACRFAIGSTPKRWATYQYGSAGARLVCPCFVISHRSARSHVTRTRIAQRFPQPHNHVGADAVTGESLGCHKPRWQHAATGHSLKGALHRARATQAPATARTYSNDANVIQQPTLVEQCCKLYAWATVRTQHRATEAPAAAITQIRPTRTQNPSMPCAVEPTVFLSKCTCFRMLPISARRHKRHLPLLLAMGKVMRRCGSGVLRVARGLRYLACGARCALCTH